MAAARRWVVPVTIAVIALGTAWSDRDQAVPVLAILLLGLTAAWWVSPLNGARGPRRRDLDPADRVVIYWRPGCVFCLRLRGALGRDRRTARWVSIWADEDAAAYVRSVNDGNETVPTVVIDGVPHTNPDPALVRAALSS
jgi:mycoredoxin